eukprot:s6012_g1.t1
MVRDARKSSCSGKALRNAARQVSETLAPRTARQQVQFYRRLLHPSGAALLSKQICCTLSYAATCTCQQLGTQQG